MKRLGGTVLGMEAIIVLLTIVPAAKLGHVSIATAGEVCGAIAVVALVLARYIGRRQWALYAGSAFQAAVIASGVLVPVMYALGVIFTGLWFTGVWLARKWERPATDVRTTDVPAA